MRNLSVEVRALGVAVRVPVGSAAEGAHGLGPGVCQAVGEASGKVAPHGDLQGVVTGTAIVIDGSEGAQAGQRTEIIIGERFPAGVRRQIGHVGIVIGGVVLRIHGNSVELARLGQVAAQTEHIGCFQYRAEAHLLLDHEAAVESALHLLIAHGAVGRDGSNGRAVGEARNLVEGGIVDRAIVGVGRIAGRVLCDLRGTEVVELAEASADGGLAIAEDIPGDTETHRGQHRLHVPKGKRKFGVVSRWPFPSREGSGRGGIAAHGGRHEGARPGRRRW